ncbi:hypothetical protein SUGI_1512380 [Cryptomeria japonica]|uniref:Uncharacterized protein n=1 Tax=Cryptomeria japonica TaxID=3369 RepID=A0AAD3NUI5_CRYJA|nr:hypothetical protein SUGI_1512380 [Cryptomeria japonica]
MGSSPYNHPTCDEKHRSRKACRACRGRSGAWKEVRATRVQERKGRGVIRPRESIGKNSSYLLSVVICFRMDGSSCGAEPLIIVGRGRPEPIPPYYL